MKHLITAQRPSDAALRGKAWDEYIDLTDHIDSVQASVDDEREASILGELFAAAGWDVMVETIDQPFQFSIQPNGGDYPVPVLQYTIDARHEAVTTDGN